MENDYYVLVILPHGEKCLYGPYGRDLAWRRYGYVKDDLVDDSEVEVVQTEPWHGHDVTAEGFWADTI